MSLRRMAYWPSLLCLAIWTTLHTAAAQTTAHIPAKILNLVPACAQNCFEVFISTNLDRRICGDAPSLQCLCRQRGKSGYTIGEGALSCILGESMSGSCKDGNENGDVLTAAYNMCSAVSDAASKTHPVIVATSVTNPSGTRSLPVPTPTETVTSTRTTTALRGTTTTVAPDESISQTTPPTNARSTAYPNTASPTPSASRPQLDSSQIAGITLGCAAVVIFGILLVFLGRCIRRRRFGDLEAGFSKMRESMSLGRKSRHGNLPVVQITSPLDRIPAERNLTDPRWQPNQPTAQPEAVGLAISPFGAGAAVRDPSGLTPTPVPAPAPAPAQWRVPKVVLTPASNAPTPKADRSPPKPTLTLAIPKGPERVIQVPASRRDSVVTEFAEDGEYEVAPVGSTIWRPPPTDPQSATRYYFVDKGGNWILRNTSTRGPETRKPQKMPSPAPPAIHEVPSVPVKAELPSPEDKTKAERAKEAYGGFSPDAVVPPLRLPFKPDQAKLGSPIAFKDQRREPRFSSSHPRARLSQTAETVLREPASAKNRPPDTYFAMIREARDLTGGKNRRRSARRTSRRVSQDSATSIESAVAEPFEDEDIIEDEPQVDLSPVVESPQAPISPGKSPVTYPKIRRPTDRQQVAAFNRTPEADLLPPAHRYNMWHPQQTNYRTAGENVSPRRNVTPAGPPQPNWGPRPWNAPSLNPVPNRNPGQLRTGSPETRLSPVSPIEQQYWQRQRQVANPASYWSQPQRPRARTRPPQPTPLYELPAENIPQTQYNSPPQQRNITPRPAERSSPSPQTPLSADSSSQSSLLAKRRGADKAAVLALADDSGKDATLRKAKTGWTREEPSGPVPITPGWVPELTPTRKGNDLFLNVR
ncbi:hypothetical protein MMYC01_209671 [Madurella mycetomatis]|uniref:Extracellular membrane protein CFEM domain-containing protein n=1 Tax=Madurella mycetomatis TaxID=100816 RepID=A0A175VRC0_9PEZI|nr:hypothetical protein MMYC01_209671 [Madurella mycetomatis]